MNKSILSYLLDPSGLTGLEPAASTLIGPCFDQLNYNPKEIRYITIAHIFLWFKMGIISNEFKGYRVGFFSYPYMLSQIFFTVYFKAENRMILWNHVLWLEFVVNPISVDTIKSDILTFIKVFRVFPIKCTTQLVTTWLQRNRHAKRFQWLPKLVAFLFCKKKINQFVWILFFLFNGWDFILYF